MLRFTRYAEQKFELLHPFGVFLTREQIEEAAARPDQTRKKGHYLWCERDGLTVVLRKEGGVESVITFFPGNL